ncbi:MAG: Transcription initiation factor IIB [Promethearchaeota archaeon]|nr:MAG: Transcription initiation factor IIB [Candidatus Lokiarchaeota archaeon]
MDIQIEKNNISDTCPECGGDIISIEDKKELVCSNCGLVISERGVDFAHSGKRAYTESEKNKRQRTGSPISNLIPDMELTTIIDKKNIQNPDLKRAAKWDTRMPWKKRNLLIATTELKRISSNLNLPTYVKEEAIQLYKEAFKKKLLRGRSINAMVAACLYFACRKKKVPRTLQEILEQTSESGKDVRRSFKALVKELKLKAPNTDPSSLIPRYIAALKLPIKIEHLSIKIVKTFRHQYPTSGKDPKGICAGAIYFACKARNINITQKELADAVGVTEVTLRSRYKEMKKFFHSLQR